MNILACGGELKSTFCILKDNPPTIFIGPTIGDLEDMEKLNRYEMEIAGMEKKLLLSPGLIAYDMHPEYLSTKYATGRIKNSGGKINGLPVQHHYAHSVSCLADSILLDEIEKNTFRISKYNPEEKFIGVAFDGLGYGDDGNLWGAEFFIFNLKGYKRAAHLEYIPLPGGAAAVRQPWRMGCVLLQNTFGDDFLSLKIPFVESLSKPDWKVIKQMIEKRINSPLISSMGRLFDAAASILNIRGKVDYEAQAAIELEKAATSFARKNEIFKNPKPYNFIIDREHPGSVPMIIRAKEVIRAIAEDITGGVSISDISMKFHLAVSELILDVCKILRDKNGVNKITLSGGVFQNRLLFDSASSLLRASGFDVLTHKFLSPNDSSICVGQAILGVRSGISQSRVSGA